MALIKGILLMSLLLVNYATKEVYGTCVAYCTFQKNVQGTLTFTQTPGQRSVTVTGKLTSALATNGLHGFHVHVKGDISNDCLNAGPHFNPLNETHGGPTDNIRHLGDYGNMDFSEGVTDVQFTDWGFSTIYGHVSGVFGRTLVLHYGTDDLGRGGNAESLKTGNAGARLDCCVIGRGVN